MIATASVLIPALVALLGPKIQDPGAPYVVDRPETFRGQAVFQKLYAKAEVEHWKQVPVGEIMGKMGVFLIGTPYVAFTLERDIDHESCRVDLTGLDCVTFFEDCLGFARMLKHGGRTPSDLLKEVRFTRYRAGELTDFTSRLHYTTDWIYDNGRKGTVRVLAPDLPGTALFEHPVGYMTTHPEAYPQLAKFKALQPVIGRTERAINARKTYYVPVGQVGRIEPFLKTGDIIGITTRRKGIDCSHTGFCIRDASGTLRFIDASQSKGAVTYEGRLSEYLRGWATGIMIARPVG